MGNRWANNGNRERLYFGGLQNHQSQMVTTAMKLKGACSLEEKLWPQMVFFHSSLWLSSIPLWRRQWQSTPVHLPGKSHERRSLVGCSPWGRKELDRTEQPHFHFSLSCIGEGNGNPLQCSCLENPRDGGAWWAAVYVYGVTQSRTRLKWLSSSSIPLYVCTTFSCK